MPFLFFLSTGILYQRTVKEPNGVRFLASAGMSNLKFPSQNKIILIQNRTSKKPGCGSATPERIYYGGWHLPESLLLPQPIVGFVLLGLQLKKEHQMI
jgi:hypothetical protein